MTATRSAMVHARPRSWVTMMMVRPSSSRRPMSSCRISPRTDASRFETGSSATITSGSSTSAPAITTRWRWPPESSCGYRRKKRSGGRKPALARAREPTSCSSGSLRPAVDAVDAQPLGHDLVDRLARVQGCRSGPGTPSAPTPVRLEVARRSGVPSKRISPPSTGCRPMIARASVVLPQPDSPASATISPRRARTTRRRPRATSVAFLPRSPANMPTRPAKVTWRSRTSRTVSRPRDSGGGGAVVSDLAHAAGSRGRRGGVANQQARGAATLAGRVQLGHHASGIRRTPSGTAGGRRSPDGTSAGSGGSPPSPDRLAVGTAGRRSRGRRPRAPRCTGAGASANTVSAGPSSTILPAYMIASRSATLHEHRQVVGDEDHRQAQVALELLHAARRTWACTITSSAVVGSSAITSEGEHASAIAIITRCFCPPDSSCG